MRAIQEAIDMAKTYGIGVVSVKRSTHFGMAASYVLPAIEAGFIAMVFSNASPAMPPWGGREGLLGTNPFAVGAPGGTQDLIARTASRQLATQLGQNIVIDNRPGSGGLIAMQAMASAVEPARLNRVDLPGRAWPRES